MHIDAPVESEAELRRKGVRLRIHKSHSHGEPSPREFVHVQFEELISCSITAPDPSVKEFDGSQRLREEGDKLLENHRNHDQVDMRAIFLKDSCTWTWKIEFRIV